MCLLVFLSTTVNNFEGYTIEVREKIRPIFSAERVVFVVNEFFFFLHSLECKGRFIEVM